MFELSTHALQCVCVSIALVLPAVGRASTFWSRATGKVSIATCQMRPGSLAGCMGSKLTFRLAPRNHMYV